MSQRETVILKQPCLGAREESGHMTTDLFSLFFTLNLAIDKLGLKINMLANQLPTPCESSTQSLPCISHTNAAEIPQERQIQPILPTRNYRCCCCSRHLLSFFFSLHFLFNVNSEEFDSPQTPIDHDGRF